MSNPATIKSPVYVATVATSSVSVTIESPYVNTSRVIVDNTLGTTPVFITSGRTAATAVFPASSSVAVFGAVVAAGSVQQYAKDPYDTVLALIRASGSGDVYLKLTSGD